MESLIFLKKTVFAILLWLLFVTSTYAEKSKTDATTETREFVALSHTDIKPPFTQKTVVKLNKIVRQSYDAINEFDSVIADTRQTIKNASAKNDPKLKKTAMRSLKEIHRLEKESKKALKNIIKAATKLRNSDEEYNNAILEGMIEFVEDVEKEISLEVALLDSKLNKSL